MSTLSKRLRGGRARHLGFACSLSLAATHLACLSGSATSNAAGIDEAPASDVAQLPDAQPAQTASSPNQPAVAQDSSSTFPALNANQVTGISASLLGFAGAEGAIASTPNQSIVVRARPFECLEVRLVANNLAYVRLGSCSDVALQRFDFADDGHVELAMPASNGNETTSATTSATLCLAATGNNTVGVASCADDANQRWAGGGHLVQHAASGLCLSRHVGTLAASALALAPCRRDDAAQSWAIGIPVALQQRADEANPSVPAAPAVGGSAANALVGFARGSAPPPRSVPMAIALRQGLDHCFASNPYATAPAVQLWRCEEAPRLVWQPDGHLESQGLSLRSMPGCMAAGIDATDGQPAVTFGACADDANQRWGVSGHNVVHLATNLCLAYDETVWYESGVGLKTCDANEVRQAWAFGDYAALRVQAKAAQQGDSMAQLCAVQVPTTAPPAGNANVTFVLNRFGGSMASFARAMQQALASTCMQIYQTPESVEPLPPVTLQFAEVDKDSVVARARRPPYPVITFASDFAWTRVTNPNFTSGTLTHEATHVWDRRWTTSGINYGFSCMVEGYADWVVFRMGNKYRNRSKGGAWDGGYDESAYFLTWLDAKFPPTSVGQRFTERAKAAGRSLLADPNFFAGWVVQQTGQDVDKLWAQYQASF